ncbi:MAG: TIR domain-containing protein [Breznakibacter sp.]
MIAEIERLIEKVYLIQYDRNASSMFEKALVKLEKFIEQNHFLKTKSYLNTINQIREECENLSSFTSDEDRLLQKRIQKRIANLARIILDENKRIFVVHGRNIVMRDKVCALLGRLKLDYVILEAEHNTGTTIIEKFLKNAAECRYAIVLFSADDLGKLNIEDSQLKSRTRQNVILELGYFLSSVGRKNITILHETGIDIERPSDFDGIVYEPFDEYGAWKSKLIKEMRKVNMYIDQSLADRV